MLPIQSGELLRDCGYSLKKKGYTIKVLNLDEKAKSNHYNPFVYIKELPTFDEILGNENPNHQIQEDDVMTLINTFMANTKVEEIENTSRRSILESCRDDISSIIVLLCYKAL